MQQDFHEGIISRIGHCSIGSSKTLPEVGDTRRQCYLVQSIFEQWLSKLSTQLFWLSFEALLLTHGHADAILGLDSLREVQLAREPPTQWVLKAKTPIFASRDTVKEAGEKKKVFVKLYFLSNQIPNENDQVFCSKTCSGLEPFPLHAACGLRFALPAPEDLHLSDRHWLGTSPRRGLSAVSATARPNEI